MAESARSPSTRGSSSAPTTQDTPINGSATSGGDNNDTTNEKTNRLATPMSRGARRSPTTGHVRRRRQSASSEQQSPQDDETPRQSSKKKDKQTARSLSTPGCSAEGSGYDRISTSEDDDDYWHAYFAVQSKNIAAHHGNSIAAAAAGVLRPGPPRTRSTINRKSTAEKALADRRPSAPDLSTVTEPLPPTPKPALRRRVRSKSGGPTERPPSPAESDENRRNTTTASETSSTTSKETKAKGKGDKSVIWNKWKQAPPPAKKEVLSIDPAEVLRGLISTDPDPDPEPEPDPHAELEPLDRESHLQVPEEQVKSEERRLSSHQLNGETEGSRLKSPEDQERKKRTTAARKPSLRKERLAESKDTATEKSSIEQKPKLDDQKVSWWKRLLSRAKKDPVKASELTVTDSRHRVSQRINWFAVIRDIGGEWGTFTSSHPAECARVRLMWNRCVAELLLMLVYCGLGGLLFRFIEGAFESFYKCGVKRVKRDFIDKLWTTSHNLREEEWKSRARRTLWEFEEQLHAAHEAGVTSYSGIKSWSFMNAVVYCLTIVTTIGYGHISPSTNTGRAATILYAIFGIPLFLILLADFGKLFTRGIKFVWSFVRRLYYTGSCRQVRRTQPVQPAMEFLCAEIMKGAQMVYDLATFRRPSAFPASEEQDPENAMPLRPQPQDLPSRRDYPDTCEPPTTPAPSAFEVDDEFNLPISVAIFILLLYIFIGASIYYIWESWGFFESFYFVFISMSTIGFGDFVPQHPMYMMASIIYLVFGLALTSMCINVVQEKLSDSFRQASAKIGATIGLRIAEEEASTNPETPATGPHSMGEDAGDTDTERGHFLSPNDAREIRS